MIHTQRKKGGDSQDAEWFSKPKTTRDIPPFPGNLAALGSEDELPPGHLCPCLRRINSVSGRCAEKARRVVVAKGRPRDR